MSYFDDCKSIPISPKNKLSIYLSYLLRHDPKDIGLVMDKHGYVEVDLLIKQLNECSRYHITREELETIVFTDEKGRYAFSKDGTSVKACQGHSIPWVVPELEFVDPPRYLYHGTTIPRYCKIREVGYIDKMSRHAVHLTADIKQAWKSAIRRRTEIPIVLQIDATALSNAGYVIGKTDNDVWCIDRIPEEFIVKEHYKIPKHL